MRCGHVTRQAQHFKKLQESLYTATRLINFRVRKVARIPPLTGSVLAIATILVPSMEAVVEDILEGFVNIDLADGANAAVLEGPDLQSVPLESRTVKVAVNNELAVAEVQERFNFCATSSCNVTFKFPLPPKAAVFR